MRHLKKALMIAAVAGVVSGMGIPLRVQQLRSMDIMPCQWVWDSWSGHWVCDGVECTDPHTQECCANC
jgi:hypothetical protein